MAATAARSNLSRIVTRCGAVACSALMGAASGLYTAWREHRLHRASLAPTRVE